MQTNRRKNKTQVQSVERQFFFKKKVSNGDSWSCIHKECQILSKIKLKKNEARISSNLIGSYRETETSQIVRFSIWFSSIGKYQDHVLIVRYSEKQVKDEIGIQINFHAVESETFSAFQLSWLRCGKRFPLTNRSNANEIQFTSRNSQKCSHFPHGCEKFS